MLITLAPTAKRCHQRNLHNNSNFMCHSEILLCFGTCETRAVCYILITNDRKENLLISGIIASSLKIRPIYVNYLFSNFEHSQYRSVVGIVVSIAAFQAVDPGSIPGRRRLTFLFLYEFGFFLPFSLKL